MFPQPNPGNHQHLVSTPVLSLSGILKQATADVHTTAERSGFFTRLFRKEATREDYGRYLSSLLLVYSALEEALLRHRLRPAVKPLLIPDLFRTESIERDLETNGLSQEPVQAATAYSHRLSTLDDSEAHLLAAHVYTRYLGDLYGGQMLSKLMARNLGLHEAGLSYYYFGNPEQVESHKARLRSSLDALPVTSFQQGEITAEARLAFTLTTALSNQCVPAQSTPTFPRE